MHARGPSNPAPQGKDTILQAIEDRVPDVTVEHARGADPIYPIAMASGYAQLPSGALTVPARSARSTAAATARPDAVP